MNDLAPPLIVLNETNFEHEVLSSDLPVLVDFTASWCEPRHQITPLVRSIAGEYAGRVKAGTVDVDESPAIKRRFAIRALPTVIVFEQGKRKAQFVGVTGRERILKMLGLA
jgi:thioredoxin 1